MKEFLNLFLTLDTSLVFYFVASLSSYLTRCTSAPNSCKRRRLFLVDHHKMQQVLMDLCLMGATTCVGRRVNCASEGVNSSRRRFS